MTTAGNFRCKLNSGFQNQFQDLFGFIKVAVEEGFHQVLIDTIRWKDQFGFSRYVRFDAYFDVVHWNSYYPTLPRLVTFDSKMHREDLIPFSEFT